jgi:hypothetical protein
VRRVADFPAGGERLTADQPTGMRHLFVNGRAAMLDGDLVAEALVNRPGMLLTPG